jgi:hypothetical protein
LVGEGGSFTVPPNTPVRYGNANVGWVEKMISGSGLCTNEFFGFDTKTMGFRHCYIPLSVVGATPPTAVVVIPAPTFGNSTTCGVPDVGGWTLVQPSKYDASVPMASLTQPGSRLHYISAVSGNDTKGQFYFWNGSKIVDASGKSQNASGVAYGTDPLNPSAAVQAFKRWSYVGPRRDGEDVGVRGKVGAPTVKTRAGYPDWWLFKRGETFDLSEDFLSYEREVNPAATALVASLTLSGGRSATEPQLVGAYGDACAVRPRFVNPLQGFITRWEDKGSPIFKNVIYQSLHFDGHDRSKPASDRAGLNMLYQNAEATHILFEDMWFDAAHVSIQGTGQSLNSVGSGAQVTLRRSLITDAFTGTGAAGVGVQGVFYDGNRDGRLRIEESILLRNGFKNDPKLAWPPTGAEIWSQFDRNMYLSGETNNMGSALIDSVSMLGSSGDQFRQGFRVERNFFYQGYVSMGAHGGYPDTDGPTGTLLNNILQRFEGKGTDINIGQPGWGFSLTSGAFDVEVAGNIVTGVQYPGTGIAFGISPLSWQCFSHKFHYATRANRIHDNIFESPDAPAFQVEDGIASESPAGCTQWQYPGVKLNTVTNNVMISPVGVSAYKPVGAAVGKTNDTAFSGNSLYANRAAAATALGWANPNRSLKTYLQANGVTVTSNDGFLEYHALATKLRRGQWQPQWTSKAIVNHIRTGYNLTALP